jgi:hypothetical protein
VSDPFDLSAPGIRDRIASRGELSLASQVLYQCRVLALLRENLDRASELLRDPVLMQREYAKRWGE